MNLQSWASYLTRFEDLLRRDGTAPQGEPDERVEAARGENAASVALIADTLPELVFEGYADWGSYEDAWVLRNLGHVLTPDEEHQLLSRLDLGTTQALSELIVYIDGRLAAWQAAAREEFVQPQGEGGPPEMLTGAANTANWQASRTPGTHYYTYAGGRYLYCDQPEAPVADWLPLPERDSQAADRAEPWGETGWFSTPVSDPALYGGDFVFADDLDGPWLAEDQARAQLEPAPVAEPAVGAWDAEDEAFYAEGTADAGDWGEFEDPREARQNPRLIGQPEETPTDYACPLCTCTITREEFAGRKIMRCPGEMLTGAVHRDGIFVHVECQRRPRCTTCGAVLGPSAIVTTDDPPEEIKESWGAERIVTGWRGTRTRQSGTATCYAGAIAAALDGLGRATPDDRAIVHGWAMNDPQDDSHVQAYRVKVAADVAEFPGQPFSQRYARIAAWDEWNYVIGNCWGDLMVAAQGVPGLTLSQVTVSTGDEIIAIIDRNQICIVGDPSHYQVVYGYVIEASTKAARALCWDAKAGGAARVHTIPGAWEAAFAVTLG